MRLELKNVGFRYGGDGTGKQYPWLFRGVNLSFESGCRVALLGDSGSGKTTLGKLLAHYEKPVEGEIVLPGAVFGKGCYPVQLILQHPETAVNPRFKMRDILTEGWSPGDELLERLGIERSWFDRYPQELSGGELQRFCIARALVPSVRFIIADEITAMFDLITQAQIWEALLEEIDRRGIGLIAITHDRDLARRLCYGPPEGSDRRSASIAPIGGSIAGGLSAPFSRGLKFERAPEGSDRRSASIAPEGVP